MTSKILAAALLLAGLAFARHADASTGPVVSLQQVGTPVAGQSFTLQLVLADPFQGLVSDESLLAWGFHLGFDASRLQLEAFTPAAGWENDSAHLAAGVFSASTFPGIDNAGQPALVLGTLSFDVLRAGTSHVTLTADAGDLNQGLIYLEADPIALSVDGTIAAVSAVPEPGSLALTIAGVGVFAWRRRRQVA